jgi:hypothetical protein
MAHAGQPGVAGGDGHVGQFPFGTQHPVDFFLEAFWGDKLADKDVLLLADAEGPADGLVF